MGSNFSTTELYDYATGSWTNTGALNTARLSDTATLLPNGQVLVVGGQSRTGPSSSAEFYDPISGIWSPTNAMIAHRWGHSATLLPNGKVLVAGGDGSQGSERSAELFDPATGAWTFTGSFNTPRYYGFTATLLLNGKVLLAGGSGAGTELYDPAGGTWRITGSMTASRSYHTATSLPNGKVLVTGGANSGSAELYDLVTGTWLLTGQMSTVRSSHTATLLPNGMVLVVGGEGSPTAPLSAELYDPASGTWSGTGPLQTGRYSHTATLLLNGKVLVASSASAELYDPATRTWTSTALLKTARNGHTATLLPNGTVLAAGGTGVGGYLSSSELYEVGLGFNSAWQPTIGRITSPLNLGGGPEISGSGFRGVSGGSSGNTQDSPADYPVVQLRSLESAQTIFLSCTNWSTNSFTSTPVNSFPPGYALVTVFVNGIPSTSSVVNVSVPIPTAPKLVDAKTLATGSFQFAFTNSVGAIFGALPTTNVALPLTNWTALGGVTEISPGQFQFTDPQATNSPQSFYLIRSP